MVLARAPLTAAAIALLALAAGCSLPAPYQAPPPPPAQVPVQPGAVAEPATIPAPAGPITEIPGTLPPAREYHLGAATRSLVTQAHTEQGRGDLPAASMTLDRALRIEPHNPLLWIEIGRLRLAENDARQAEGCGRKALALASGDRSAQSQAGRVLADALRAQQRNQEAREIESQPWMN